MKVLNAANNFITPAIKKAQSLLHQTGIKSSLIQDALQIKKPMSAKEIIELEGLKAVEDHHCINGLNCDIRYYFRRLRKGQKIVPDDISIERIIKEIERFDKDFGNLPPLKSEHTFYRGMSFNPIIKRFNEGFEILDAAKVGDIVIPDTAYPYTAFDRLLAEHWANGYDGNMLLKIIAPEGSKLSCNLEHGGEAIFPRSSKFEVLDKIQEPGRFEGDKLTTVILKYLP